MQIIHKKASQTTTAQAHGGSGSRKLFIDDKQTPGKRVQGMAHGWLPAGQDFDWHSHQGIEEVVYVLKGSGRMRDRQGECQYSAGDVLVIPAGVEHKIENPSSEEHEFIFIRIYV